ncbi:MAG: hypothetical protein F9K40_12610 [Kofleriaceae bacterium]|nr:MAG: hypothetical protein F9K40_12610 [Kofleriaceae bacterium]MBZ0234468.1 hypothetical protein [Kofleriaceae bacterium]
MSSLRRTSLLLLLLAGCGASMAGNAHQPAATAPPTPYAGVPTAADPAHASVHAPAPAPSPSRGDVAIDRPAPDERPGLGTTWGESIWSPVTTRPFERSTPSPWAIAAIHYNDEDGVRAHAAHVGGTIAPLEAFVGDGSIGVSLVGDGGDLLPGVRAAGRNLVVGADGDRYRLVVRNATSARFEVVASVDGLDVIDGQPASPERRGYIVDPYGVLVIDGFRQTESEVAAFRFGKVAASYAARTSGDANVGVVGIAIFAEKGAVWTRAELERRDQADPFPARTYATPPR